MAVATLAALSAAGAAPALASHSQTTFFEAPNELLEPATRASTLSQLQWLGVNAVRVQMSWYDVAPEPESKQRPNFDATDPASYNWGQYEELLAETHRLGWKVLLTVSSPVPRWATSNKRAPYVTRPDDRDFEEFMTAVARKFSSDVYLYAIWNEPNEYDWLQPQFNSHGRPEAPRIYRGLFQAGYEGLRAGGLRHPKVLMGETSPDGFQGRPKPPIRNAGVAPITFLRGMLCLNARFHKAPECGKLPAYGYSQHPYTAPAGPYYRPSNPAYVTIGTLGRLVADLNKAAKAHAIRAQMPVFLTEFGIRSKPEPYNGVPAPMQAEFDAISERIAWQNPRVASFSQYLLKDNVVEAGPQTGLEYVNGRPKPLYYGFPVPLTVTALHRHGYALWGFVRPADKATTVTVLVQRKHSKRYVRLRRVRTNGLGYWHLRSNVPGRYWRVVWISPQGTRYEGPPIRAYGRPGLSATNKHARGHGAGRASRRHGRHRRGSHAAALKRGRASRRSPGRHRRGRARRR